MASTMKDIAKETGLGLATISKYLNGGNVRARNKILIDQAISELGFTVNEFARGLKTNRSRSIGVIIPELSNLFITSIITVIEDILRKQGYAVIVCDCRSDEQLEKEAVQFLVNRMVDGIINMPVSKDGAYLEPALVKGIPIVMIDRKVANVEVDAVLVDNINASENAISHLIVHGHSDIGIVTGPKSVFTSQQRLLGYNQALIKNGIMPSEELIAYSDYTVQGGYESMKAIIRRNKKLSAVFITNYEMTLGAIIAINELGIKIPQELSVIGFDNMELSQIVQPKLTIVSQPLERIGEHSANLLLKRLTSADPDLHNTQPETIMLPTELSVGESVARMQH